MNPYFILFTILFPLVAGALILAIPFKTRRARQVYVMICTLANSAVTLAVIFNRPSSPLHFIEFTGGLRFSFNIDGLAAVFGTLIAALWPLATLFAFEYMKHEKRERAFFTFYLMTFGVTLGVAFSANALTMYVFYEMLTLITTPLVFHTQTRAAVLASRKYLYYSISGAALGFFSIIFIIIYGSTTTFTYGGVLIPGGDTPEALMQFAYVLAFIGFGVKAAIFPLHGWLPSASVAPTPVTALLHAVAVVKSGVFAIMRMTFYIFGADFLRGTWAQMTVSVIAIVTILFGSSMAVKEQHFKRRLAYSTVSNLSYILVGVTLMTPLGFAAALAHMVFHAVMKICGFFCAGAVMYKTGKTHVYELDGLGRKMPFTFTCFTVASLALVGTPGFMGFVSKWALSDAALAAGTPLGYVSVAALFISALLVAIYMLSVVVRAFFPAKTAVLDTASYSDPNWLMKLPLLLFSAAIVFFGIFSAPLLDLFAKIASGQL